MTAAVYRSTPDLSLPQTQNTAPVLEFICLYTHDIRRKQKRWQDGFVRFHTFNKRVMVYDPARNFVGSAHWTAVADLQQGDELRLDKEAIIVEVAESVGRTETDLTELRQSRKKASSEIVSSSPMRAARIPLQNKPNAPAAKQPSQPKHRSLNALLGASRGPIGKATLPKESPYQRRQLDAQLEVGGESRPQKRARAADLAEPRAPKSATRTGPAASKALPRGIADQARQGKEGSRKSRQQTPQAKEVIDICHDEPEPERFLPGFSSDMLSAPASPSHDRAPSPIRPPARSSSPAFQTQRSPADTRRAKSPVSSTANRPNTARQRGDQSGSKAWNVYLQDADRPTSQESDQSKRNPDSLGPPTTPCDERSYDKKYTGAISKARQKLRIGATSSKKTLLCQDQLSVKPKRISSINTDDAAECRLDATVAEDEMSRSDKPRQQLQERLQHIRQKKRTNAVEHCDASSLPTLTDLHGEAIISELAVDHHQRPRTAREADGLELTHVDLMLPPIAPPLQIPSSPEVPPPVQHIVSADTHQPHHQADFESNQKLASMLKRMAPPPLRITRSPPKRALDGAFQPPEQVRPANDQRQAKSMHPRSKKSQPSVVNLNLSRSGTTTVILSKPFRAPIAPEPPSPTTFSEPDPWSREAFDLFTWRPPGWDEERWCVGD